MSVQFNFDDIAAREAAKADKTVAFRKKFDAAYLYFRSCAVCSSSLPPIDLLCPPCWKIFGKVMNRGEKIQQKDYPFPVYSLLTWTPETEVFVKPFIYGFKGERAIRASEKLASFFLSERSLGTAGKQSLSTDKLLLATAPSSKFDHASLWAYALGRPLQQSPKAFFLDVSPKAKRQKELSQTERAERRFKIREVFAGSTNDSLETLSDARPTAHPMTAAKRVVFADDVITSGATAMAAYMALGDPDKFEVWTLAARPRLAGKSRLC